MVFHDVHLNARGTLKYDTESVWSIKVGNVAALFGFTVHLTCLNSKNYYSFWFHISRPRGRCRTVWVPCD
jgi:hypothetical protein